MLKDSYNTIKEKSEGLYKEKGSKFISYAFPVKNKDEVKIIVDGIRKEFHDARHHCWAYSLGPERKEFRVNDDGEPSNSAGKPILGQIQSYNVSDILIVVVRYFGGTLLGVGGLIHAYKSAAADCLEKAIIVLKKITKTLNITCDYKVVDTVMKIAREEKGEIVNQKFEEICSIEIAVRLSDFQKVFNKCKKLDLISIE